METACSNRMLGRILNYGKRHGLRATLGRAGVGLKRALTGTRMVLFGCELRGVQAPDLQAANVTIERKNSPGEVDPADLKRITNAWNVEISGQLTRQRFERGASLWLLKSEGQVAAYGWTIRQETMEPHYFPLSAGDVHLFDFFVFPEFRGRRFNPLLVNFILARLALENASRAFIEAAEWNTPQLSSLGRTPFRLLGSARKFGLFGKMVVMWGGKDETDLRT
jgi:GNAT superfamily N-acetyltransferase